MHTLGFFVLALQVQDGAAPVTSGSRVLIDIITKATVITHGGAVVSEAVGKLLAPAGGNA